MASLRTQLQNMAGNGATKTRSVIAPTPTAGPAVASKAAKSATALQAAQASFLARSSEVHGLFDEGFVAAAKVAQPSANAAGKAAGKAAVGKAAGKTAGQAATGQANKAVASKVAVTGSSGGPRTGEKRGASNLSSAGDDDDGRAELQAFKAMIYQCSLRVRGTTVTVSNTISGYPPTWATTYLGLHVYSTHRWPIIG